MQKKLLLIIFTIISGFQSTECEINPNGSTWGTIKTVVHGIQAGTFQYLQGTPQEEPSFIKDPADTKNDVNFPSPMAINKIDLLEIAIQWVMDSILKNTIKTSLCEGKGNLFGKFNSHCLAKILVAEAVKLGVQKESATNKHLLKEYLVNVLRSLSVKDFAIKDSGTKTYQAAVLANTFNNQFYKDLKSGTVDWNEASKLGGKYHSLASTIEFILADKLYAKTTDYFGDKKDKNGKIREYGYLNHNQEAIVGALYVILFPYIKYTAALLTKCCNKTLHKTNTIVTTSFDKTATVCNPALQKACTCGAEQADILAAATKTQTNKLIAQLKNLLSRKQIASEIPTSPEESPNEQTQETIAST